MDRNIIREELLAKAAKLQQEANEKFSEFKKEKASRIAILEDESLNDYQKINKYVEAFNASKNKEAYNENYR